MSEIKIVDLLALKVGDRVRATAHALAPVGTVATVTNVRLDGSRNPVDVIWDDMPAWHFSVEPEEIEKVTE